MQRVLSEHSGRVGSQALELDGVLDAVGLSAQSSVRASELSGGQQRRLHTAMSLVSGAPLLLLDEVTVGADSSARSDLLALLRSAILAGSSIIYTTHSLAEVQALGWPIVVLENGCVVYDGEQDPFVEKSGQLVLKTPTWIVPPPSSVVARLTWRVAEDGRGFAPHVAHEALPHAHKRRRREDEKQINERRPDDVERLPREPYFPVDAH